MGGSSFRGIQQLLDAVGQQGQQVGVSDFLHDLNLSASLVQCVTAACQDLCRRV